MRCLLHILNEFVIGYICSSHFTQTETDTCIRPVSDTGVVMPCPPSPRRRRAGAGAGTIVVIRRRRWQGGGGHIVAFAMRVALTLSSRCGIRHVHCVVIVVITSRPPRHPRHLAVAFAMGVASSSSYWHHRRHHCRLDMALAMRVIRHSLLRRGHVVVGVALV